MGRNRTKLPLSAGQREELLRLLNRPASRRDRERLKVALWAADGRHTLDGLAARAGRARATVQNWLNKFVADGVAGLLERNTPPGAVSPLANRKIQAQMKAGLNAGRWKSAAQIATWLEEAHGIRRARKSIYYWLHKNGWSAPQPQSRE